MFFESWVTVICECCQRQGQLRIPNGYHLKQNEVTVTISINTTNPPVFTPSDTHIKEGLA